MVSIVFNRFIEELQKAQGHKRDRDMRDPQAIGEAIINRPKGETACEAADRIELMQMPKYK